VNTLSGFTLTCQKLSSTFFTASFRQLSHSGAHSTDLTCGVKTIFNFFSAGFLPPVWQRTGRKQYGFKNPVQVFFEFF
jgi:hypothetical protein